MSEQRLDLQGLKCPLPALRAERALAGLGAGDRLIVLATDPMAAIDIPHAVSKARQRLVSLSEAGGVLTFVIEAA